MKQIKDAARILAYQPHPMSDTFLRLGNPTYRHYKNAAVNSMLDRKTLPTDSNNTFIDLTSLHGMLQHKMLKHPSLSFDDSELSKIARYSDDSKVLSVIKNHKNAGELTKNELDNHPMVSK